MNGAKNKDSSPALAGERSLAKIFFDNFLLVFGARKAKPDPKGLWAPQVMAASFYGDGRSSNAITPKTSRIKYPSYFKARTQL